MKFGYIYNKKDNTINDGDFRIIYFEPNTVYNLAINDSNKIYYLFLELYGDEENYNEKISYVMYSYFEYADLILLNKNLAKYSRVIYYNSFRPLSIAKIYYGTKIDNLVKFYLASNSLYNNIIEGLSRIEYPKTNIVFKIRRDVEFDYLSINIFSLNQKRINIFYDIQIISPEKIDKNGNILCELPTKGQEGRNISLRYSNPYNKYNSSINLDEIIVITFLIKSKEDVFPLYFNIKYFYNNSAINIPLQKATILKTNANYKIFGRNEFADKKNIIINLNKCNINKNYSIFTYYETLENIIWKKDIIDKRNIIINNNIFNNTNIKLEELIEIETDEEKLNNNTNNNNFANDDIYMNYFIIRDSLFDFQKITKNYKIKYNFDNERVNLKWSPYISKEIGIPELTIQYDIYIFPENSKFNSPCQLSLVPSNYTLINKTEYDINIPKGKYKINIIASVVNKELPLITFYDELEIKVSQGFSLIIIICLIISFTFLIIFIILYTKYIKNSGKKKKSSLKKSFWISLVEQRHKIKEKKIKKKVDLFNLDDEHNIFDEDDEE